MLAPETNTKRRTGATLSYVTYVAWLSFEWPTELHAKVPRGVVATEIRPGRHIPDFEKKQLAPLLAIFGTLVMSEFESEHVRKS